MENEAKTLIIRAAQTRECAVWYSALDRAASFDCDLLEALRLAKDWGVRIKGRIPANVFRQAFLSPSRR